MDQKRILRLGASCGAAIALACALVAVSALANPPRTLANFDDTPGQWSFSNGPEFPGSSGNLSVGHGLNGRGGELRYAFTCVAPNQCGAYVSAELEFESAVTVNEGDVLTFAISPPPGVNLALRLIDGSGQTLQYGLAVTTLEHQEPTGWRQLMLRLDREAPEHWDGADDGFVRDGIAAIAILARGHAPQHGTILIDDVRVVNVREQTYELTAGRGARVSSPVAAPRLGVNLANRANIGVLDAAHAAGIRLVRTDLFWNSVEQNGALDFRAYDPLVDALAARDMRALMILDYGHPDHGGGGAVTADADRAAYVAYARAAADHFRNRPVSYEIWNEPDTGQQRRYQPAAYALLARETAAGIHAVNRRAEIVAGGLSWANHDYYGEMLPGLRRAPLTAIALHPYRPGGPETAAADLPHLRATIAGALRPAPPLWVTEWGYSSSQGDGDGHNPENRRRQGALLARQMLTLWALRTPLAVWYEMEDRSNSTHEGEMNFGLLDADGAPKPAYQALQTFTAIAEGRRATAILRDLPPLAYGMRLEGRRDAIYAIWTAAPGGRLILTTPRNLISAQDAFGAPIAYDGERRIVLSEAAGPVYLRVPR